MTERRVHRFCYSFGGKPDRLPDLHWLRDGDAFLELNDVLVSHGWKYSGLLLNLPLPEYPDVSEAFLSTLGPADLLVLTTRPPLNDERGESRLTVQPGDTAVEWEIHKALAYCLEHCDRKCIRLAKPLADQLPADFADRADMLFRQYRPRKSQGADPREGMAAYKKLRGPKDGDRHDPPEPERTAVFVIRTRLWDGGPWILSAFAMSGNVALIWAHLLRTRYQDLLLGDKPLFFLGELILGGMPPRPFTLEFAETRQVITVLRTHKVPTIPPEEQYQPAPRPRKPRRPDRGRGRSRGDSAGDTPPAL